MAAEPDELAALRDELARARAAAARDASERDQLLAQMREANERLILATLRTEALHARLEIALEASGTGTFRWDERGGLDADHNLRDLLGVPPGVPMELLDDLLSRVHRDDRGALAAAWQRCAEDGAPLAVDVRVLRGGDPRWLAVSGRRRAGDLGGRRAQVVGAFVDVTDRRRAADEQAANQAKDEFLAMLGHELRNPLAPILTALHLIKRKQEAGGGVADVRREREVIDRQVAQLVRLVDDLLDVSRIARGKIELERHRLDLAGVLDTAVEQSTALIEARGQTLRVEVPRGGLWVDGDSNRLAQIFANLLNNAARYTPPGGRVELTARRDGAAVVVEVRDDGVGMPAHLVERVFELFVQGERTIDRQAGGLGLGLTIVKNLVEMHGGAVAAASDGPGKGSRFTVWLPAAIELPATASGRVAAAALSAISRRVLVVDDNADVAELLADLLRAHGHHVAVAHDGAGALQLVETFRPEAALLDIALPVMDGYELAANLRARLGEACPRLIALSGYGEARDLARSAEAGFARHLVKPVDLGRLLALFTDEG